ncbi:MAG: hypothetical protein ACRDID_07145, partial [Ktedonobacterales bacterium]
LMTWARALATGWRYVLPQPEEMAIQLGKLDTAIQIVEEATTQAMNDLNLTSHPVAFLLQIAHEVASNPPKPAVAGPGDQMARTINARQINEYRVGYDEKLTRMRQVSLEIQVGLKRATHLGGVCDSNAVRLQCAATMRLCFISIFYTQGLRERLTTLGQ